MAKVPSQPTVVLSSISNDCPPPYREQLKNKIYFLLVSNLFMFASMYIYALPAATRMYLVDDGMTPQTFGILAGIYSYPNIILPLFGGVLIDYYGVRLSLVLFSFVVFIGHLSYVYGIISESIFAILLGRFVYGVGGECLGVANSTVVANWYTGKDLSFCLAISLTIIGFGSVACYNSMPLLIDFFGFKGASIFTFFSLIILIGSVASTIVMDHRADIYDAIYLENAESSPGMLRVNSQSINTSHSSSNNLDFKTMLNDNIKMFKNDVRSLPKIFWILLIATVLAFTGSGPFFTVISQPFLTSVNFFNLSISQANFLASLPSLIGTFLVPVCGILIDKSGRRPHFLIASCLLCALTFLIFILLVSNYITLSLSYSTAISAYFLFGIGNSIFGAAIWSCIPFVVPKRNIGTAYGVIFTGQNIGLSIVPIILEYLHQIDPNFKLPFLYLFLTNILAMIFAGIVYRLDISHNQSRLNRAFSEISDQKNTLLDPLLSTPSEYAMIMSDKCAVRQSYYSRIGVGL